VVVVVVVVMQPSTALQLENHKQTGEQ
jgi:hypothetical protein